MDDNERRRLERRYIRQAQMERAADWLFWVSIAIIVIFVAALIVSSVWN